MSDIVERAHRWLSTEDAAGLILEMADEIERAQSMTEIANLRAEIARLRAINAELLEALHLVWKRIDLLEPIGAQDIQQIRAAIAKATNPVEQIEESAS